MELSCRNKSEDEDPGVRLILDAILKENSPKSIKSKHIKKEQLLAGVAFLKSMPLSKAKITFKKGKVD